MSADVHQSENGGIVAEAQSESSGCSSFEGTEKNLEVLFRRISSWKDAPPSNSVRKSLRDIPVTTWNEILALAGCQILTSSSNQYFDAYVLSESSLFVYPFKCVLKTCGRTTLLRALKKILDTASGLGLELDWLAYSRKQYILGGNKQYEPHVTFESECEFAKNEVGLEEGSAFVLGDLNSEHWNIFIVDRSDVVPIQDDAEICLNVMMYDLDPSVSSVFSLKEGASPGTKDGTRAAVESGLCNVVPGAHRDDWMFDPCGYSMNAQQFGTFYTVHVTPEAAFSYASFETNLRCSSYLPLLRNVLRCFCPKKFTVTIFADEAAATSMKLSPTSQKQIHIAMPQKCKTGGNAAVYCRKSNCTMQFKTDFVCSMADFTMSEAKMEVNNPAILLPPHKRQRTYTH